MGFYFEYDRLIDKEDICNYETEMKIMEESINAGDCLRVYGFRNFGKTSLVKNVIAKDWENRNPEKRVTIYIDLYSIDSEEDISFEFTNSFNTSISKKTNFFKKSLSWFKLLKNIRPVWEPSLDSDSLGKFSIHTQENTDIVNYELVLENINSLYKSGKFEFLLIFDEFQEVSRVKGVEAKMRSSLQKLSPKIPVIIMGSKYHMLQKIFDNPKAPFHSWGMTVELSYIDYKKYFEYMKLRFKKAGKSISFEVAKHIQDVSFRIPEAINKLSEFISRDDTYTVVTLEKVDKKLLEFVERSRSIYVEMFSLFTKNQKKVLKVLAMEEKVENVTSINFLKLINGISKSGVSEIIKKLLDNSVIYHLEENKKKYYSISDPFFYLFIKTYKLI